MLTFSEHSDRKKNGMHGNDNNEKAMQAILIAFGPNFRKSCINIKVQ